MQGLLDTQKPLDGQKFSIATMDTRKNIAEKTRSKIEEAFLSDDPYRDIEVFEIFLKSITYLIPRIRLLRMLN